MVDTYFLHRLSEDVHILINVLCDVTTTYCGKKQNQQRQIQILSNSSLVNHSFSLSLSFAVLCYDVLFFLMMFDNIPVYFIYSYIYIFVRTDDGLGGSWPKTLFHLTSSIGLIDS